ncbi:MAG: hypothetical protein A2991_03235 [Candidatus Terrybacteria bacterium RIFCSPLOWO2_01_FULL_58_14]|uniref:Uncharacterized protein n=2 Tax=Candidatus Terryibacteriota TaxID=1817920 RepID=A0A1G2PVP6_9BACT|nr:MAG: hypothetical protein A2682_02730 [Candidatus Terrybacteria bacterium RIFCSPHIGHO2_01_FULL_58_15]OHA52404.1 MAG: hypothetical protein A2991_03235 [Candidatus Terrybacteria bacterium RIFCSPLOWO2_01_FULL_58_14]
MFDLKKNLAIGIFALFAIALLKIFWGPIETVLTTWDPALEAVPVLDRAVDAQEPGGSFVGFALNAVCWALLAYGVGLGTRAIGLWVAQDAARARRITKTTKQLRIGWLWRLTIGYAILADAIIDLPRVRMEESGHGKHGFGFVTKVQRVHHVRTGKTWFEFIIYAGDFPTYVLGRWNWYKVSNCEKSLNPFGEMLITMATVGFGAPNNLVVDDFTEDDLIEINRRIKEREAILIATGFLDPDQTIETVEN